MIVSVPFAFQVRSSQGLVELETELARRTARRAQVKQLKSEKLSPCSRGNLEESNACASSTLSWPLSTSKVLFLETPTTCTVLILLLVINDFYGQLRRLPEDRFYVPLGNPKVSSSSHKYYAWNSKKGDRFRLSLVRECGPCSATRVSSTKKTYSHENVIFTIFHVFFFLSMMQLS